MSSTSRLQALLTAIDDCNRQDPNLEAVTGQPLPKAFLYGQRMSACLTDFAPKASEALQIAARAQHIERWKIARASYPKNRVGYLQWRRDLGRFHAQRTCELMKPLGYEQDVQDRVTKLLTKRGIKQDPEVQTLEDVICLVFVQFYLLDFAATQETDKLLDIIAKTWAKMSPRGRQCLLTLKIDPVLESTLKKALAV